MKLSKIRGISFSFGFVLTKTTISVPRQSKTAELAKDINCTGPFTSRKYESILLSLSWHSLLDQVLLLTGNQESTLSLQCCHYQRLSLSYSQESDTGKTREKWHTLSKGKEASDKKLGDTLRVCEGTQHGGNWLLVKGMY